MKLYGTPLSHFTRKVRILLDLYSVPYEFVDVGNVAEASKEKTAGNPLARVPVLVDGEEMIIDSDSIAEYLVRRLDPIDRYKFFDRSPQAMNIRSVLNGIMTDEVTQILSRRTGVPVERYTFFAKSLESIRQGLQWLESVASEFSTSSVGYREFHLLCAWQHLEFYELVPLNYPELAAVVKILSEIPALAKTSPFTLKPKGI